ncbi:Gfo/Idh/MocA family oxidoreductase [Croceicoccus sp. F390]|uniref:Gfo/Idh/MocA family oxidoreductase n=1 Tax=Croceicoccus esteveae TaxID=3075597 RepID=A0ABU2ZHQ1_9SPHN|nr:Gfo/Idh/MocA family oxidoreductase [Croceicoccus sp. F390]MDT0575881.1 Gfo/Idh/MocA family oxidoreductase [Croceicoccus sp. F390]
MNTTQPRAVVVGTGFGLFTHVRALRDAGFEVAAIVGRDHARTAERAAPLQIPLASDSLSQVLRDDTIRLVTVATPPHAHVDAVMTAIEAGRNVVCEKPFARDAAQAQKMRDAAHDAGILHMMGAEFRFETVQALLRRVVIGGTIGTPLHYLRIYHQPGNDDPDEPLAPWWEDADQGGGFLGAFGSHMFDQAEYMLGRFASVSGVLQTIARGRPHRTADDAYSVQFRTHAGTAGTIIAAQDAPGPLIMGTKITGSKGSAWVQSGANYGDPEEVWVQDAAGARQMPVPDDLVNPPPTPFPIGALIQTEMDRWHTSGYDVPPYARLFGEMRDRMAGREPDLPERAATFDDAVQSQKVLDAVRESSRSKQWIDIG